MALTEEQREVALRAWQEVATSTSVGESIALKFAARFLAALPKPEPAAWVTTNEDGDYAMLFFDKQEARSYSGDDEPIGLAPVSSSAPQPDYKAQRDAERYRWLCEYLIGPRCDLDDTIISCASKNDMDGVIDAAKKYRLYGITCVNGHDVV